MRLVYGQQESLQGSSLQNQDSDSDDEDLFRLRKDNHKVCFNSCDLSGTALMCVSSVLFDHMSRVLCSEYAGLCLGTFSLQFSV